MVQVPITREKQKVLLHYNRLLGLLVSVTHVVVTVAKALSVTHISKMFDVIVVMVDTVVMV